MSNVFKYRESRVGGGKSNRFNRGLVEENPTQNRIRNQHNIYYLEISNNNRFLQILTCLLILWREEDTVSFLVPVFFFFPHKHIEKTLFG